LLVSRTLTGGAKVIKSPYFEDARGWFSVPYERASFAEEGIVDSFVQDNHSYSAKKGTIRGIHLQLPPHEQGKLVRILSGSVLDVVVDLRPGSDTFGHHDTIKLEAHGEQLWVPKGFGHAFCTLEEGTEVFYKVDAPYKPESELSLAWNDPTLSIEWPDWLTSPNMSDRDRAAPDLAEITASIVEATK